MICNLTGGDQTVTIDNQWKNILLSNRARTAFDGRLLPYDCINETNTGPLLKAAGLSLLKIALKTTAPEDTAHRQVLFASGFRKR